MERLFFAKVANCVFLARLRRVFLSFLYVFLVRLRRVFLVRLGRVCLCVKKNGRLL